MLQIIFLLPVLLKSVFMLLHQNTLPVWLALLDKYAYSANLNDIHKDRKAEL